MGVFQLKSQKSDGSSHIRILSIINQSSLFWCRL